MVRLPPDESMCIMEVINAGRDSRAINHFMSSAAVNGYEELQNDGGILEEIEMPFIFLSWRSICVGSMSYNDSTMTIFGAAMTHQQPWVAKNAKKLVPGEVKGSTAKVSMRHCQVDHEHTPKESTIRPSTEHEGIFL